MDFSLKDLIVPEQEDNVPFIGDLIDPDSTESYLQKLKTITVKSIYFNGSLMKVDVTLTADYDNAPQQFNYVIVGVRLLVPADKSVKEKTPAVWAIANINNLIINNNNNKVKEIPIDIEVTPGPVVLASFLIMKINDFHEMSFPSVDKIRQKYSVLKTLDEIIKKGNRLEEELKLPCSKINDLKQYLKYNSDLQNVLRSSISSKLSQAHCQNWVHSTVYAVKKLIWAQQRAEEIEKYINELADTANLRLDIITFIRNSKCLYVSDENMLERNKKESDKLYAMFFNCENWSRKKQAIDTFLKVRESNDNANYCFVDLDFVADGGAKPFVIQVFEGGKQSVANFEKVVRTARKNVVKYDGHIQNLFPKRRGIVQITCPGFEQLDCPQTKREWICEQCEDRIYYGFDSYLYCTCGAKEVSKVTFRCERTKHTEFIGIGNHSVLEGLVPLETLNIIVLGPTGVGKSTWINAFVNYMSYSSLQEARKSKLLAPIPVAFSVTDKDCKSIQVRCGDDDINENLVIGNSATMKCRQYSVVYENRVFNIIDTPGLGDTRGIEEDKKNVKHILDFLQGIDNINGICLLLKPNEARVTLLLKYCLKEFLTNLHKSSSQNLLFCFTHARSTFYRPGETLATLRKLLTEIDVDISCLNRSFYLDNEAFRFLCCLEGNIAFSVSEEKCFSESWDKSVAETKRLLDEVATMVPHETNETLSLNRARTIILNLIPFLIDITENIERNLRLVEEHSKMIRDKQWSLNELKAKRYVHQIDLERTPLPHPRTVCCSERCVTYHILEHSKERKVEYSTHCHPHCYLSGRTPDVHPNPELKGCWAIEGEICRQCSCRWDIHMHIWYSQNAVERPVQDTAIEANINKYKDANALKADILALDQRKINDLTGEKESILAACVKFACFLQVNAIIPFNDSFLDYLEMKLRNLTTLQNKTPLDDRNIAKLRELKTVYGKEKDIFEKAIKHQNNQIDPESIKRCEEELYRLPIHGTGLRDIMHAALASHNKPPRDGAVGKMVAAAPKQKTVVAERKMNMKGFFSVDAHSNNDNYYLKNNSENNENKNRSNNRYSGSKSNSNKNKSKPRKNKF